MTTISNMAGFLRTLGSFEGRRFCAAESGILLFDGGTDSAYENYALPIPERLTADREEMRQAAAGAFDFFSATGRPHIWPLSPGLPEGFKDEIEAHGARFDDVFCGMTLDLNAWADQSRKSPDVSDSVQPGQEDVRVVSDEDGAVAWADAAWYGFDSEDDPPGSFVRFAVEAFHCDEITLVAAGFFDELDEPSATGMLFRSGDEAGLYYIATRPERRNRGLGKRIVEKLLDMGRSFGCKTACLLATPKGKPLYSKCGFAEECEVPIFVFDKFGE